MQNEKLKIGLALSGGGYRAAAFHLGVLRKLNQLNILNKIEVISMISGGSIAGTYYALNKNNFAKFEKGLTQALQKSVLRRIIWTFRFWLPILFFVGVVTFLFLDPFSFYLPSWIVGTLFSLLLLLFVCLQFKILPLTHLKAKAYKNVFFDDKTLSDLPDYPRLAINSTNLSTGTLWTFSKTKVSDSSYEFPRDGGLPINFKCGNMPLAIAVASSTSVPIPFNPTLIDEKYFANKADYKRVKPKLIDGGLYDNQGIHKLTQNNSSYACDIIIVSDGSQPFKDKYNTWNSGFILYRGVDVMMRKIKNLQFIRDVYSANKEIAYFSLDWRYDLCIIEFVKGIQKHFINQNILDHHKIDTTILSKTNKEIEDYISTQIGFNMIIQNGLSISEVATISNISTNLTALTASQIDLLSRHASVLTDLQIKLYCPSL